MVPPAEAMAKWPVRKVPTLDSKARAQDCKELPWPNRQPLLCSFAEQIRSDERRLEKGKITSLTPDFQTV